MEVASHTPLLSPISHHCRGCGIVVCAKCSARRHPDYPDVRVCAHCYSKYLIAHNNLEHCDFFHGTLSPAEADERLKSPDSKYGDYLVRNKHVYYGHS